MVIDKRKTVSNIKCLVEGEFYYSLYQRLPDRLEIKGKEEKSALLFNMIVLISQLVEDLEVIKKLVVRCFEHGVDSSDGMITSSFFDYVVPSILKEYDAYYLEDTEKKMIERLYHGFSVHFTTVPIMEKIKKDGYFSSSNCMFSKEEEKKILMASSKQIALSSEEEKEMGLYLTQGFGFGKGISMGAQTVGYWMHHTPESLSFLFGGNVYTRNKEGAMEHVRQCICHLSSAEQEEIFKMLHDIWDRLVGNEPRLGAVLIDRDGLEYEKVTYWNEEPPREQEIRPYWTGTLNSLSVREEDRYDKNIPCSSLYFIKVPSVSMLEEYCKNHIISLEDKICTQAPFDNLLEDVNLEELFQCLEFGDEEHSLKR